MRNTSLKRTRRGYIRNLGRLPDGSQPKFYLGHDRDVAVRRLEAIKSLWEEIELHARQMGCPPRWDEAERVNGFETTAVRN